MITTLDSGVATKLEWPDGRLPYVLRRDVASIGAETADTAHPQRRAGSATAVGGSVGGSGSGEKSSGGGTREEGALLSAEFLEERARVSHAAVMADWREAMQGYCGALQKRLQELESGALTSSTPERCRGSGHGEAARIHDTSEAAAVMAARLSAISARHEALAARRAARRTPA